jgi:hypothetical protein
MPELIQWTAPAPLWSAAASATELLPRRALLQRPALLRFATDTFMEDFLALLDDDPARLNTVVAQPETWRGPLTAPSQPKAVPLFARPLQRLGRIARQKRKAASLVTVAAPSDGETVAAATTTPPPLKLYQPSHQRYYLVSSCLVCGRAGLPDRAVDNGQQERVSFVMRRLLPPGNLDIRAPLPTLDLNTWEEYAFVSGPQGNRWRRIAKSTPPTEASLVADEEQLPLFAVRFTDDEGHKRRLFAGLVPVGKREVYMGAVQHIQAGDPPPAVAPPPPVDSRMMLVWTQFTEPWGRLLEQAEATRKTLNEPSPVPGTNGEPFRSSANAATLKASREQIQTASWYALLDFAKFLEAHISDVWRALLGQPPQGALTNAQNLLITTLTGIRLDTALATALRNGVPATVRIITTLKDALVAVRAPGIEEQLEGVVQSYERKNPDPTPQWPTFLFPLADAVEAAPLPPARPGVSDNPALLPHQLARIDYLAELIQNALPAQPAAPVPERPLAAQPVLDTRDGWFVIRCVFERPLCGPLHLPVVSEPTQPFQLAGFFDPDAPARPIRIALPVDTSPAGLRKFDKNTAFMISDMLCGQIDRVKALGLGDLVRSVLPWPLHKDLSVPDNGPCTAKNDPTLQAGMICSFSIPIITICALLLLMIIVSLLDIIFRWLPYFFICFPLPGFKAKKNG